MSNSSTSGILYDNQKHLLTELISVAAQKIRSTLVRDVLDDTPIAVKREQWEESTRKLPTPEGVDVCNLYVGGVHCLLCTPRQQISNKVVVYCHGGGLVEGSVETFRVWTARLALHTGCRILSVDYRLAPEFPYPAALEDVLSVCRSVQQDIEFASDFCIGADSTGCALGLAALLNLKPFKDARPYSMFLLSPSIDMTFSGESAVYNSLRDPFVSLAVLKHYAQLYAGGEDFRNPDISPLFGDFYGLPPMLVLVDNHEILLDDSVRLVQRVKSYAGLANLHVSEGLWHVWPAWGEFPESTIALDMIRQQVLNPGRADP